MGWWVRAPPNSNREKRGEWANGKNGKVVFAFVVPATLWMSTQPKVVWQNKQTNRWCNYYLSIADLPKQWTEEKWTKCNQYLKTFPISNWQAESGREWERMSRKGSILPTAVQQTIPNTNKNENEKKVVKVNESERTEQSIANKNERKQNINK